MLNGEQIGMQAYCFLCYVVNMNFQLLYLGNGLSRSCLGSNFFPSMLDDIFWGICHGIL